MPETPQLLHQKYQCERCFRGAAEIINQNPSHLFLDDGQRERNLDSVEPESSSRHRCSDASELSTGKSRNLDSKIDETSDVITQKTITKGGGLTEWLVSYLTGFN